MIRPLKLSTDEETRIKSEPVGEVTDHIRTLVMDMTETMAYNKGLGLAAPQIGVNKRVVVVDTFTVGEPGGVFVVMVDPEIKDKKGETLMEEGCLSCPGKEVQVQRYQEIDVEYTTLENKRITKNFKGLNAIAVQHEIAHLNGKLIIDENPNEV